MCLNISRAHTATTAKNVTLFIAVTVAGGIIVEKPKTRLIHAEGVPIRLRTTTHPVNAGLALVNQKHTLQYVALIVTLTLRSWKWG